LFNLIEDYSCKDTQRPPPEPRRKNPDMDFANRAFNFEPVEEEEGTFYYKEHVTYSILGKGDFFGSRSLFTREEFLSLDDDGNEIQKYYGPARLSVVKFENLNRETIGCRFCRGRDPRIRDK
jgi:hypothetical protein